MRLPRRSRAAFALAAAIPAVFVIALMFALAAHPPAQPLAAAPLATIFPTRTAPPTSTASPTPTSTTPTPTPPPKPSPTATPTPSPEPSATPELILLVPLSPPSAAVDRRSSDPVAASCPSTGAAYDTLDALGVYKSNRLTDANPDLRLSLLGYEKSSAPPTLIDYAGATDPGAPRLSGLLASNRGGAITHTFRRYDWLWNEGGPPPYGARGGVNTEWPATVVELAAQPGEPVFTPARAADIGGGFAALVLFAAEDELTLAYTRQDGVADGYVVHLRSLCVDPALSSLYRAQLADGRRASGRLPALRSGQPLGTARGPVVAAVRDRGAFLDPRSRKDWW